MAEMVLMVYGAQYGFAQISNVDAKAACMDGCVMRGFVAVVSRS